MSAVKWCRDFVKQQFWGGHPNTFRSFYAWASLSYAGFMAIHPEAFDEGKGFTLMRMIGPASMWASLFAFHWLILSLILIPPIRDRVRVSHRFSMAVEMCINCYGFSLWATYVALQDLSLGYPALNSGMERIALAYSVWVILRTGMGRRGDAFKIGSLAIKDPSRRRAVYDVWTKLRGLRRRKTDES
jgi:hypothetical protein